MQIAIEAKATGEQFLLNRTPKLERYYNSRRSNSVVKIEHRSPTHKRKQGTQTLVSRYIEIYDDIPIGLGNEWQRQMKERPVHPAIPEGNKEESSGRGGKESKRKKQIQTTLSNFISQRIGTEQIPKMLKVRENCQKAYNWLNYRTPGRRYNLGP